MSDGRDGRRLDAGDRIVFQPVARPDVATEVGNIDVGPLFGLPPVSILRPADFLAPALLVHEPPADRKR